MSRFICTADWHLRADKPRCRLDEDWLSFQEGIVEWIVDKANEYSCGINIVGDIFDTPNVPASIISMFLRQISKCKEGVQFIAGNHDLPYHSFENLDNSSIGIIYEAAQHHSKLYHGMACGRWADFDCEEKGPNINKALFIHRLVFENSKTIPPNVQAITASELLDEYPDKNWIFTGDNHHAFHYEKKGRHVLNPGCITRQASDFIQYQPSIYFVDTDENIVEAIPIPDTGELVTDAYIQEANAREDRIGAFVEGVKKNGKISLSFTDNIETALLKNKNMSKETITMIHELMEDV